MTHFGLICPTAVGHLNTMTTLGHELKQRGHRATLVGLLDAQPNALAAGLEFRAIGEEEFPSGSIAEFSAELGEISGLAALRFTIDVFVKFTSTLLQEAPKVLKDIGAEALIIDQISVGGSTVAELMELPFITICSAVMMNKDPNIPPFFAGWSYSPALWARLRNQFGHKLQEWLIRSLTKLDSEFRQQHGLSPYRNPDKSYSQLAQICQQPAEFEYPRPLLPPCFHFTGAITNPVSRESTPFPYEKLTGQPLIYASLGTVQNRLTGVFQAIAEACQDLDAQLVIALGSGITPESMPDLPGSPLVVGFAPQLELLQRAALTITHAGMNTALESLGAGVPMVAIPIANDQHGVAKRIVWTGAGEEVSLKSLNVPKLRSVVIRVLTEGSYRTNALRLKQAIKQAGGVKRAADIVEQVVATGKPVIK